MLLARSHLCGMMSSKPNALDKQVGGFTRGTNERMNGREGNGFS